jgi:hypothetical protein
MSQRLSPASSSLVGVNAGGNLIVNLWSVPILQRSHDYLCSYTAHRPPTRQNVPNARQSTTVIARLCLPIHVRKRLEYGRGPLRHGRGEADERENRAGEDEEHQHERHDAALSAEA